LTQREINNYLTGAAGRIVKSVVIWPEEMKSQMLELNKYTFEQ